jgi:hypothetical protein
VRWFTWLMPVLALLTWLIGLLFPVENVYQTSTGWIGLFVFTAAFFVLLGVEKLLADHA